MSTNRELADLLRDVDFDDEAAVEAVPMDAWGAFYAQNVSDALLMPEPSEDFLAGLRATYVADIDAAERILSALYERNNKS